MIEIYLIGPLFGIGVVLCVSAFAPAPQPLQEALARFHRPAIAPPKSQSVLTRLFGDSWISTSWGRRLLDGTQADLRICETTPAEHLAQRVSIALIALLWAPATTALIAAAGIEVPWILPIWTSLVLAPIGFLFPSISLKAKARARRRAFRHAFSSFLDIVSVSLAGGRGVDGALNDASEAGNGWAFVALADCLMQSRLRGETPWMGVARLGRELQISELEELAASANLAGAEGARVRASIAAKAKALRLRGLTDIEAAAQSASERMSLPIVALMVGFVVFLGYPAVMSVMRGL